MLRFAIVLEPDGDSVLATSHEIPIVTFGHDAADAMRHAADAVETVLEGLMDWSHDVPLPEYDDMAPGPFVRVPLLIEMKARLYDAARKAGVSRAELCRRLNAKRETVDRLFRLDHNSTVAQLDAAFAAIGADVDMGVSLAA